MGVVNVESRDCVATWGGICPAVNESDRVANLVGVGPAGRRKGVSSRQDLIRIETTKSEVKEDGVCRWPALHLYTDALGRIRTVIRNCGNQYDCPACAAHRRRRIQSRVYPSVDEVKTWLNSVGGAVYLLTFTLDGAKGERYAVEGRKRLSAAVNRFNSLLYFSTKKAGVRNLLKLRVYEFHKDGAWHAHMVLVLSRPMSVRRIASVAYKEGFYSVKEIKNSEAHKVLKYVCKYVTKPQGYVPKRLRAHCSRMYHLSGRLAVRPPVREPKGWKPVLEFFASKGSNYTKRVVFKWKQLRQCSLRMASAGWLPASSVVSSLALAGIYSLVESSAGLRLCRPSFSEAQPSWKLVSV